jgi:hypothetical protein
VGKDVPLSAGDATAHLTERLPNTFPAAKRKLPFRSAHVKSMTLKYLGTRQKELATKIFTRQFRK